MNSSAHNFFSKPKAAFTLVEIMIAVAIIGLLASIAMPAYQKIRNSTQDKAVLNNAKQLAAAADQYMMETGKSWVIIDVLVGPTSYIKSLDTVANESYPTAFTQGHTITITNVANSRTITYGF